MVGGDIGRHPKRFGDSCRVGRLVLGPLLDSEFGRIDSDHTVLPDADVVEDSGDAAGLANGVEELLTGLVVTHRRVSDRAGPDRGNQ